MQVLLPLGWFVPVSPGTRYVTVGGAIGADIHGKNHHASGSFSRHVRAIELLTGDGETRLVTPEDEPDLFWATAGGMGLTGVVLAATIQLLPVETSLMTVDTERATDLDDLMARLTADDHRYRYSVAWIDLLARGAKTGRAVLTRGDHAPLDALPPAPARSTAGLPARRRPPRGPPLPARGPAQPPQRRPLQRVLVPQGARASSAAGSRRCRPSSTRWTACREWNRIYGRGGFVQYQFVVGHGEEDALRRIVRRIGSRRCPSFLAVLKRFGDGDPGWLSFPIPGWTLALDIPATLPGLAAFLDELDDEVAAAGGRVYLAKDARLRPDVLGQDVSAAGRLPRAAHPLRPARRHHLRPRPPAGRMTPHFPVESP